MEIKDYTSVLGFLLGIISTIIIFAFRAGTRNNQIDDIRKDVMDMKPKLELLERDYIRLDTDYKHIDKNINEIRESQNRLEIRISKILDAVKK